MKTLPCPFCGAEPEIIEGQFGDWFIMCSNPQCDVKPNTGINEIDEYANTLKVAIKKWDKRYHI